jgi:3-oxoacyl-[acyl-carrier-protein] synthase-1
MHRVAITGIGIVSCLGCDIAAVADALYNGRSGIIVDEARRSLGFNSLLTGHINFNSADHLSRKQRKTMPEFAVQAYAAAEQALLQSGLSPEDLHNDMSGLIFGCDSSGLSAIEQVDLLKERGETTLIGSGHVFRGMTSTVTLNLNTIFRTRGACWTISSACASGGNAIGQAADLITLGRQERILCGAAQELNWQTVCSFDALGAFSAQQDPRKASRPFDANRDGLVPSGGAAAVLLERYDLAIKRGAKILGEVRGYGFSSDGDCLSVPSRDGLGRAMKMAMNNARITPADIGYINAHATSTPLGDAAEAENIRHIFGKHTPPIASMKSMTGHELWMSGASQVVYSTIMAQHGFLAPNINFDAPDESTSGLNILTEPYETYISHVLCNSAGFGGTNASLILGFAS